MRAGIVILNTYTTADIKTSRGLHTDTLCKYVKYIEGHEPYIIGKKIKDNTDPRWLDYRTTDINDFDIIYLQNAPPNFFGGLVWGHSVKQTKELCRFKGPIYALFTDARIPHSNTAAKLYKGTTAGTLHYESECTDRITAEEVKQFANLNITAIWTGHMHSDYDKFFNNYKVTIGKAYYLPVKNHITWPFWEFMAVNYPFKPNKFFSFKREFDLMYYGFNRGSERFRRLNRYLLSDSYSKYVVGIKDNYPNTTFADTLKHEVLMYELQRAYCSLVLTDLDYSNIMKTLRFYEGIIAGTISIIDVSYDMNRCYYSNKWLTDNTYIDGPDELAKRIKAIKESKQLFDDIIGAQYEELKKYNYLKIQENI
jgi:hypothetical protein